jgi:hypothetical protein
VKVGIRHTHLKSPFEMANAHFLAAVFQLFLGEFTDAKTSAAKSITLSDENGFQENGIQLGKSYPH